MAVQVGDIVKKGQLLFTDKKCEGVRYTAPAGGRVAAINRGAKRAFQSIVIEVDGDEAETFPQHTPESARALSADDIKEQLIQSGQWTAIKARPFGRVADPATTPSGLFITAIDTHPHAPDPEQIIAREADAFALGQALLAEMVTCPVYLCAAPRLRHPRGGPRARLPTRLFRAAPSRSPRHARTFFDGCFVATNCLDDWLSGRDRSGSLVS